MRRAAFAFLFMLFALPAFAGDAEVKSAQTTIDSQLKAFLADDGALAYSFAAPNVKRIFPTVESFMSMVVTAYPPVHRPRNYSFGKVMQTGPASIVQQVMILGPDGNNYEAVYTLEMQADGTFKITGCSLKASNSLST